MAQLLDWVVTMLGIDPFTYLAIAILSVVVWTVTSLLGNVALTGPSLWLRRVALLVAVMGTVLFAYTARTLK